MMKKILVFSTCVMVLGLMTGSAIAQISYCKDILEPGNPPDVGVCDIIGDACTTDDDCTGILTCLKDTLKTWDETWEMPAGETIDMDIWLNDVPNSLLTAGCYITYDPSLITITNIIPFDTNNGGPWNPADPFSTEPGIWVLQLLNLNCVVPDGDGDIALARVTFQCQAVGDVDITISTVPGFDTVVDCDSPTVYDSEIVPNIVTVTQVCTLPGDCPDDGNFCTVADCDGGTCVYNPVDCDDADACTVDSCHSADGSCVNDPVDCDDGSVCTDDSCDPATGSCVNDLVIDCSDGDLCTQDICDPGDGSCSNPPETCDDSIDCTDDTCDPASGCQNEDNCDSGFFCDVEAEPPACEQVPTTTTTSSPPPPGCTTNDDCDDGVFCNGNETCTGGSCVDGSPPCRAELCDEDTDTCIDCLEDADCDDGVDCTDDSCVNETCVNMSNDENCPDDGLYCNGEEFCDEADGCSSTGDPCGAGETCDEETDSCVGVGGCSIDVVQESLPKSNWVPLGPGIIRINTVGVNLTIFDRINIACDSDGMGFFPRAVIPLGRIPLPSFGGDTTVVIGYALILPASWTGSLGMESETCNVTVGTCDDTDTFDLQYLSIGNFPLSE